MGREEKDKGIYMGYPNFKDVPDEIGTKGIIAIFAFALVIGTIAKLSGIKIYLWSIIPYICVIVAISSLVELYFIIDDTRNMKRRENLCRKEKAEYFKEEFEEIDESVTLEELTRKSNFRKDLKLLIGSLLVAAILL